ncbi:MAG: SUMF1/EgtB/PvdO family nonheme iron enzyme [Candidatus Eisenbacteria bacterium]|nr:SUMF1/EgtB/PvdO family nonheme iron enzyme [Candidatus Eisenbacteria bacterium]
MGGTMRSLSCAALMGLSLSLAFAGCDDDDPVGSPESGTIEIEQTPDELVAAAWSLTGPQAAGGAGDSTLVEMPPGAYTATWDYVEGFLTPLAATQTLTAGETITFRGTYVEDLAPAQFVRLPAGAFIMGSPAGEPGREADESQHEATLTAAFEITAMETTNGQYAQLAQWAYDNGYCTATSTGLRDALDGSQAELLDLDAGDGAIAFNDGRFSVEAGREAEPVTQATWYGAAAYCDWLSLSRGLDRAYNHDTWRCNDHDPYGASGYRLPTEAEWEYACRAGTQTVFSTGTCLDAGTEANYDGDHPYQDCPSGPSEGAAVLVGSFPASAFGLFDMHGNVREWCNDRYGDYSGDVTDPAGPATGSQRILRGGGWSSPAADCRAANRDRAGPGHSSNTTGFRVARSFR